MRRGKHQGSLRLLAATAAALAFAALSAGPAWAAYPLAGSGRITLERQVGGVGHVFVMKADGTNPVDLSPASTLGDSQPQFSPDGRWIVFTRQMDSSGGLLHIFRMRPDGSGAVDLTPGLQGAGLATYSPDGKRIAFVIDTNPNLLAGFYSLAIMNADGSGVTNLTEGDESFERSPDFSPDGARIVFQRDVTGGSAVFAIGPDGSNPTQLSQASPPRDVTPAYSPRGDRIAWARDTGGNDYDIFIGDTALGGATDLTPGALGYQYLQRPAFSPDATRVAFAAYDFGPDREVFAVPAAGGPPQDLSLTSTPGDDSPHWEYVYRCAKRRATIVGDDGPDKLKGTKKADVIVGNGGRDRIRGLGGNDRICGGAGPDSLIGGAGTRDRLVGGAGKDKVKQ